MTEGAIIEVDARGHRCPTPTLRLRRALADAPGGSMAALVADDPLARVDIPHFAQMAGYDLIAAEVLVEGDRTKPAVRFLVRKPVEG